MTDEKKPTPEELAKKLVADGIANKNHDAILTEVETHIGRITEPRWVATDYLVAIVSELLDHIADLDDQVESKEYDRDQLEKEIREAKDNRAEQLYLKADINDPNDPHWTNYLKEVSDD